MVNHEKIRNKLRAITTCLEKLEHLKKNSEAEFLDEYTLTDTARHNLQIAVEAMLDISNHIIARHSFEIPKNNAESFTILCRHNILSKENQETYTAMAKFRNRIVHMYDDIDNREVYKILQDHLDDYRAFIQDIMRYTGKG
jgi:uncharacterized protein YutE (UPF0331/DUF86 family)